MKKGRESGLYVALCALLTCMLLVWCPRAFALNPALDVSQYAHASWKIRDGFPKGQVTSIAQTPDGYLWLGTEFGLVRFDGVKPLPWQPPADQKLPSSEIFSLLAARDGTLWIGTSKGLASWKDNKLTQYAELAGYYIFKLLEDREGTVWASGLTATTGRLCAIRNGSVQCDGDDGTLGRGAFNLYKDSEGNLWAGVKDGVWRWRPGPPKFYALAGEPDGIQGFSEDYDGALLVGCNGGIQRFVDGKTEAFPLSNTIGQFRAHRLLRDRDGGLWVATSDRGLVHIHQGRTDVFASSDGLSGDLVYTLFEDREGNIWVSTSSGLDRFRNFAVATFNVNQGLSNASVGSVLAARDGSVWFAGRGGLNRWNNGQITTYRGRTASTKTGVREIAGSGLPDRGLESLFQDNRGRLWVTTLQGIGYLENDRFTAISGVPGGSLLSIAEDAAGNLWIANERVGLFQLLGVTMVRHIPWTALGHKDHSSALAADPLQGGLWLGFHNGGIVYFAENQIRASYTASDGLAEGRVNQMRLDGDGTLWVATEGGLSRLKNGRVATMTSRNGLPCDTVHWAIEDDARSFWLYTACGLVRVARSELEAWATAVDQNNDAKPTIRPTVFDSSDGVRILAGAGHYSPQVTKSTDGRLWFLPLDGVSVLDPSHLPFNSLPPPVHIEQVTADRKTYDTTSGENLSLRLPQLIRDLQIDYAALSFVTPEKVLFRYKLEGYDRDWQDAGNRRQAFYTNLPPGNYTFRVIASNNDGVWNESGAVMNMVIPPAFYQTLWFRALTLLVLVGLIFLLYVVRLRRLGAIYEARMEERIDERERIARDLHDTLLQGFLSASMQLHVAAEQLPTDSPAKPLVTRVLELMRQVTEEGRTTLKGLRSKSSGSSDLALSFYGIQDELALRERVDYRVTVEGPSRPLHPDIRDEIYHIGREALVNAFRHSRAKTIEVELQYGLKQLRVLVRDDGRGIDPQVLRSGREGHWGIFGMRERADEIGARLKLWSRAGAGTEVELSIPGQIAYEIQTSKRPGRWLEKLYPGRPSQDGRK